MRRKRSDRKGRGRKRNQCCSSDLRLLCPGSMVSEVSSLHRALFLGWVSWILAFLLGKRITYRWRCVVGLVVAVGTGDHDFKIYALLTIVCGVGGGDAGAPEGALVICDGRWVRALVGGRVQTGISLDVDVESGA